MKIFICQTPFQLFYANTLIIYFKKENLKRSKYLIIHSNLDISNLTINNDIELINLGFGFKNRFYKIKDAVRLIRKITKQNITNIDFFIPHISGLIPNFIFFNKRINRKYNLNINFYYEGILYFYDFQEKFKKFHIQRFAIALLFGFIYRFNKIILPYNSKKIKNIYSPIKKFTKGDHSKIIEIPFNEDNKLEVKKNHFLILGGPVEFLKSFYEESLKLILSQSKNQDCVIYYKPHASFETHYPEYNNVFSETIANYNLNYIELSYYKPVESLLKEIKPISIYSYYSSALLNINLIFPESTGIVCFFDKNNDYIKVIESIFKYFNIKIIEL